MHKNTKAWKFGGEGSKGFGGEKYREKLINVLHFLKE